MSVQSISYGAVQTAYVSYTSYDLDVADTILDLFWPTPYSTSPNILAATTNFVVTATGCEVNFPNANEVSLGMNIFIRNDGDSSENIDINNNIGTPIQTIAPGEVWWIQLTAYTNDSGGTWIPIEQGAGTSQATAADLAGHGLEAVATRLNTVIPPKTITANYTITGADQSGLILINSTGLVTITLGAFRGGFSVSFNNIGTGNVFFTGTVNNSTTFSIGSSQTVTLINDAIDTNKWWTLGLGQGTSFLDSVVSIDLTDIAAGGNLVLSTSQLNAFIQQFYSDDPITGNIIIYYGNNSGNWYVANFCSTSNGSTISLSLGSPTTPVGTALIVPMGAKLIYYAANDPTTNQLSLFTIPSVLSLNKIEVSDGTSVFDAMNPLTTGPSYTFSSDQTSGMYLDAAFKPSIATNGTKVATFDGTDAANPKLLIDSGTADYPSYGFFDPDFGIGIVNPGKLGFFGNNAIAANTLVTTGALTTSTFVAPTSGNTLSLTIDGTDSQIQTTIGASTCNLSLVPGVNTAQVSLATVGGAGPYSSTFTVNNNGTTLVTQGIYPSTFQFFGATTTTSLLKFYNNSDVNKYAILGQSDVEDSGNAGVSLYYTADAGTTTARMRLTNAGDITRTLLAIYSPANGNSLFFEAYPGDGRIGYLGVARIIINAAGVVTFDQRASTLNALLPNPATVGNMIAYDGTNWILTPNPNAGSLLYYKSVGGWTATATPSANSFLYYSGTDWISSSAPNNGSFSYFNGTNWINTAAASAGNILYYNGTNWVSIAAPSTGGFLYYNGTVWKSTATPTLGDITYFDGTDWVNLAPGADGEVLTLSGGVPTWAP